MLPFFRINCTCRGWIVINFQNLRRSNITVRIIKIRKPEPKVILLPHCASDATLAAVL